MEYISKEAVIAALIDEGYLGSNQLRDHIKPGHGPCCTCQTCGFHHDDCVCDHNDLLNRINSLGTIEVDS